MSEPLKNPGHAPESYDPKEVPEIVKMAAAGRVEEHSLSASRASSDGSGILPSIRGIFDGMKGHNYGLPDCLSFIWEHLNETVQPDYWDFAATTGDSVAMVYNRNLSSRDEYCVSGYLAGPEHIAHCFNVLGYGHSYVTAEQINADKERVLRQVKSCIDKGLPVLALTSLSAVPGWHSDVGDYCLIVGYEEQALTLNIGIKDDSGWLIKYDVSGEIGMNFIFVGEKRREITMEDIYLGAAQKMTHWLTLPEWDGKCFGAAAFRAWADDIEGGRYEDESIDLWDNYGVYVCNLATSPGVPSFVFRELAEMNSAHARCMALHDEIGKIFPACLPDDCVPKGTGKDGLWTMLERFGGGLYAKRKVLQSKNKCRKIAAALREYAGRVDEVVRMLEDMQPESYDPKELPEIVKLASEITANGGAEMQPKIKAAPAAIKAKARDQVRIIELPACKMVTSGPDTEDPTAFERFDKWWTAYDKSRTDHFYARDFMWCSADGAFEWGYAVLKVPKDTGGFGVIDFPGGLYAVAISVDNDSKDHDRVYKGILDWVKKSGCFALDENDVRRSLGNITSPVGTKEIMGYHQMDLYFPIRIKQEDEQ